MNMRMLSLIVVFLVAHITFAAKPTEIQYVSPIHNSTLNSRMSGIIIRPGDDLDEMSIDFSGQIVVTDTANRRYSGDITLSTDGKTLIFKPHEQYEAGEDVHVAFLSGVTDISGDSIPCFEFQFTVTPLETALDPKEYVSESSSEMHGLQKTKRLQKTVADGLPSNFPDFTVTPGTGTPADGYIFLSPSHFIDNKGFNLIVDNSGNIVYWEEITDGTPVDFKVLPNGYLSYGSMYEFYDYTGGGPTIFRMMDSTYTVVDSFEMGNGYVAESHEFQLLPNGHALMLSYDLQPVDMSELVDGGHPGAMVVGSIIQELDVEKNVVFQWRSWDYLDITDSYNDLTLRIFDPIHINSIDMDSDNHLLVSIMGLAGISKINRQTGEIMWTMGGVNNEFTFVNEEEVSEYAPEYFMYQHEVRRLDNGNILMIDDGNRAKRNWSRAVEYEIDETTLTATNVWQYRPDPDICINTMGSAQRLPNGNTLIGWGMASATKKTAVTEVDASGNVVLELAFDGNLWSSYRAYKFEWDGGSPAAEVLRYELGAGNSYTFNDTEPYEWSVTEGGDTSGISIDIESFSGFGYNEIFAVCYNYAPLKPQFSGKPPIVLPHRIVLYPFNLADLVATLKFDTEIYGIDNPDSVIVYYRAIEDSGEFTALPTSYNPVTKQVTADLAATEFGEFIFAYSDYESQTYAPLLVSPSNDAEVNIANAGLEWSPVGYASTYSLQVATDEAFSNLVVDESGLKEAVYTFDASGHDPATYYWRVNTANDVGESEWSTGKVFHTREPYIQVTYPNGGDELQYGIENFITWTSITEGDVIIELHKDGSFLELIDTTTNSGGYAWDIPTDLTLTSSYKIMIKDAADESIYDLSDETFSLVNTSVKNGRSKPMKTNFQLLKSQSHNPVTVIRYHLDAFSKVDVSVYSIQGQKVATLVDRKQAAGSYEVTFDASKLASTIYIFKFQAGENFVQIRKRALMK